MRELLYLRLEAGLGEDIMEIAQAMVDAASRLRLPVVVKFNGHNMIAKVGEAAERVVSRYQEMGVHGL